MSQEARDERLGLTGLDPEQRRRRIAQMERELAAKFEVAKRKLEEARARHTAGQDDHGTQLADPAATDTSATD